MSNEADCRTAPATPGLLNIYHRLIQKYSGEGGGAGADFDIASLRQGLSKTRIVHVCVCGAAP